MSENIRKSTFVRQYCYDCGTPWGEEEIICPKCGSGDCSPLVAKPMQRTEDEFEMFQYPWEKIPWPEQGAVCLYGGPGTGKSSISSLIRPKYWLTKEQEPKPASMMFRRLTPENMPKIYAVDTAEEVEMILSSIKEGPLVIDSLTAFGLKESLEVAHMIVNWSRQRTQRVIAILQANQGGGAAGYLEIPHLFDAVINIAHDPWGTRCFRIEKSRWSGLYNLYFTFDDNGQIIRPTFPASYTVEGSNGSYYLHPYPVKGAKWTGLSQMLHEFSLLEAGTACAAQIATYMTSGFVEPMDVENRRQFAEQAGLHWVSVDSVSEVLADLKEQSNQNQ